MGRWIKTDNIYSLPNKSGIYAIYNKTTNELLYIGSSTNLRSRMMYAGHFSGFDGIRSDLGVGSLFIKYRITDWLFAEKTLIRRLKPKYNRAYAERGGKRIHSKHKPHKKYDFGII